MVKKIIILLSAVFMLIALNGCKKDSSGVKGKTTIYIEYTYPELFEHVQQELIEKFKIAHPEIEVVIRKAYQNYEDATQSILRSNITGDMPDITFQGLNRFRALVDQGIAVPLNQFISKEKNFGETGFNESMFAAGKFGNDVYGLPFAVSLPIAYYNMDLVKKAGWDPNKLPETWEEAIELAQKIDALGKNIYGMFFNWQITGNWFWQALVFSQGGTMLTADEKKVAFDGTEGQWAMNTYWDIITKGKQPNRSSSDSRSEFASGLCGMWFSSTADLFKVTNLIGGKFELKTNKFPSVVDGKGKLPAGGNGALIVTKDPKKKKAAWEVLKFWCGEEGAVVVAEKTGYMPPNKVAAEKRLMKFYNDNPNNMAAVKQLNLMTKWYAYPGENSLKITDVIYGHLESVATGKAKNKDEVLTTMAKDVQDLLPKK